MKSRTVVAGLSTLALASVITSAVAPMAVAHERDASATASQPTSLTHPYAHGVEMTVRNDTGHEIRVCERATWGGGECKETPKTLQPGQERAWIGQRTMSDDLELTVIDDGEKVFEIDGNNPNLSWPAVSIQHTPTGGYSNKSFSVNEAAEMNWGRAWVKRNPDTQGSSIKRFDVHIKRTY